MTGAKNWTDLFERLHSEPQLTDPPPCPHCGRCVFCGPPCCDGMAADIRAYQQSPEYLELVARQRAQGKAAKHKRRCAKFQRRLDKLAAKTWDTYDQFLADQSAWEGLVTRESE